MPPSSQLALVDAALRDGADLRLRVAATCADVIVSAAAAIETCLRRDGKVLFFGNGGSAADAQHLAAEFTGRFQLERRALPAIALTTDTSALTAIGNDYGFAAIFARQIEALGRPGDVAVAITTSGTSPNITAGVAVCRRLGILTIGLTSSRGIEFGRSVDHAILVPSAHTARVQECHITIGHLMCELVENALCCATPTAEPPSAGRT
jgi:D-sedoheptulose 7-phosphate isomerase